MNQFLITKLASLVLVSLVLLTGCGPALVANGPWPDKANKLPSDGLAYYLPVDKISVNATVTVKDQWVVDSDIKLKQIHEQTSTSTIGVTTVADTSKYFLVNITPNGTKDQTLDISVGPDGLLTNVTYVGTDRISETIASIAKATADVAGTFVGSAAVAAADLPPDTVTTAFEQTKVGMSDKADKDANKPGAADKYNDDFGLFKATPALTIYFLAYSPGGRSLWDKRAALDESLAKLIQARIDLLAGITKATKDQVDLINGQAAALSTAITAAQDRRDKVQTLFQAALDQYVADKHLGPAAANAITVNSVLSISDLASTDEANELLSNLPHLIRRLKHPEIKTSTTNPAFPIEAKHPAAWNLLLNTGVLLTVDPDKTAVPTKRDAPVVSNSNTALLAYRQAVPYLLTTYTLKISPDEKVPPQLTQTDQKVVPLIPPDAPTLYVAYDSKAFSDQKLTLNFAQGRLTGVSQGATASTANAAAGFASAIDTGLTTYGSALTQEMNNQKTQQTIIANQLSSQLATLNSQKSILDAQIVNQGEHADAKLILQKQELDQRLATLQSQVATQSEALNAPLLVQQSGATQQAATLQAQQNLTNLQATAQVTAQQAIVKSQVDLLTQEVSLLTQQVAEMTQQAALKKGSGQ